MHFRIGVASFFACALALAGCGSSSSPPPPQYTVGGSVSGLAPSTSVVLQNNGGDDLTVSADGPFTFATKIQSGKAYDVTVLTAPQGQSCTVANGSGTAKANVTDITVSCAAITYPVGGTLAGLPLSTTVVLQNNGGDNLTLTANGPFTFATHLTSGAAYDVRVLTQPAGATCTIANPTGTLAAAAVTNVNVTCSTSTYTVGGTASGLATGASLVLQNNGTNNLTVSANSGFTFTQALAGGSAYAVTVLTQPTNQICNVTNGTGTLTGNVTNVQVSCVATFTVGGNVTGLAPGRSVVLQNNGANNLPVSASGPFTFTNRVATGGAFAVTVLTQPADETCTVTQGSGTVAAANVTTVQVDCLGAGALQRWTAPTTWAAGGPSGTAFPDSSTMVQHAYFSATGLVELKSLAWQWHDAFGGPATGAPTPTAYSGFPVTKYAGGPFKVQGQRYQASSGDSVLDKDGDLLVCAIVKPYFDPVGGGYEYPIIGKGVGNSMDDIQKGGWVLMQMHESFCFHYEVLDASNVTHQAMAYTTTYFADGDVTGHSGRPNTPMSQASPLNPGYVVVCAGRDAASNHTVIAVNNYPETLHTTDLTPYGANPHLDVAGSTYPGTIGGYSVESLSTMTPWGSHANPGQVFETAVWHEAATPENIQAKFAAVEGLLSGAHYARNREGLFVGGADNALHGTWRHGPRIDREGWLFGLQGWNRVNFWMPGDSVEPYPMVFAASEDLTLWDTNGGATVQNDGLVKVPGDSPRTASKVTLPAGASISIVIDQPLENPNCHPTQPAPNGCSPVATPARTSYQPWVAAGPVQGQVWVRPVSGSGTLRVRMTNPDPATPTNDQFNIDLSKAQANAWNRVWLGGTNAFGTGLLTTDGTTRGTLSLENASGSALTFYAWGVDLTQVAGGGDAGYASTDLGPASYDFLSSIDSPGREGGSPTEASRLEVDALELADVPQSTSGTGFCLSVDAAPAANLAWNAGVRNQRTLLGWYRDSHDNMSLYVDGTAGGHPQQLCFDAGGQSVCANVPSGWTPGSKHNVKACVSATGDMRLYNGDTDTQLGSTVPGVTVSDLVLGHLVIGNGSNGLQTGVTTPWQGHVSKALVCADNGSLASCQ